MKTQFIFCFFLIILMNAYSQESSKQQTKMSYSFILQKWTNARFDSIYSDSNTWGFDDQTICNKWVFQDGIGKKQFLVQLGPTSSSPATSSSIISFTATPTNINIGQSTTLTPVFNNAASATIILPDGSGMGPVVSGGTYVVTPQFTLTYELVVDSPSGERETRTVTVSVNDGLTQFLQQGPKEVATNAIGNAQQGGSVSISADGNTAIIGGESDNNGAGAAWIWTRSGENWTQGPKLVGSGAVVSPYGSGQGRGVAISDDGNTAIVGGWNDTGTWVFTRNGNVWTQQGNKLVPTGVPGFGFAGQGSSVALSADGNTAIIGGPLNNAMSGGESGAWIWTRNNGVWTQQGPILVGSGAIGDAYQGSSVAISDDGNTALVGGPMDNYSNGQAMGAAWVWTRSGGVWTQQGSKLFGTGGVGVGAQQGCSVSLSADGNTAIIGGSNDGVLPSNNTGAAWIWIRNGGVWTQQGPKLVGPGGMSASTLQGFSVSLSGDGNSALVGGVSGYSQTATTLVWKRSGGIWTHQGTKLVGSDAMGVGDSQAPDVSVSLSADGKTAIVGGSFDNSAAGTAWVYFLTETIVTPSLVKLTNTILNNPLFTAPKILWEGNTNQIPATIKICADGSHATKIQFTNNTGINSQNLRFWIESDPYGSNSDLTGYFVNYLINGNTITAEYAHPKYLPSAEGLFRADNISIVDCTNPGYSFFTIPIRIYRAPVLFIHGLNGDASTFALMATTLINNSYYTSTIKKVIDYNSTSMEAFASNVDEIPKGIDDLLFQSRNNKYSAGKVDIVSHSMGGILSRLYLQSNYGYVYRDDVNKLITLNTPHSGSQFANWTVFNPLIITACGISTLFYQNSWLCNGAGIDLQTYSYAIDHVLNSPTSLSHGHVPSHTVSSFIDDWDIGSCVSPIALGFLAINGFTVPIIFGFGEQMDGVVRLDSQQAGLTGAQTSFPIEQCHLGAAENDVVINDVTQLLCENPNSNKFSLDGFHPEAMKSKPSILPTLHDFHSIPEYDSPGSFVTIQTPTNGSSFISNQSVSITVNSDTSIKRMLFLIGNSKIGVSTIDTTTNSNTVTITYQIPPQAIGEVEIDVIGFDPVNVLASSSVTIDVTPNAIIDSLVIIPENILVPVDNTNHFHVLGYYSDGINRDVTMLSNLQCATEDISVAKINSHGIIEGVSSDSTLLIVSLQGVSDTIPVYVYHDSTLSLPLFSSNSNVICSQGGDITFFNLSSGNPQSIHWLFPGGNPNTSEDSIVFVNYNSPGIYDVSIIASYTNKIDTLYLPGYITVCGPPFSTVNLINDTLYCSYTNGLAYLWYHNGIPINSFNHSFMHPDSVGEYYVDVMNDAGCVARSSSYFYSPTGMNYFSDELHFLLYPNPTSGNFTLDIGNSIQGNIKVFDMLGAIIYQSKISSPKTIVDLANTLPGIYFVQLQVGAKFLNKKLVIY